MGSPPRSPRLVVEPEGEGDPDEVDCEEEGGEECHAECADRLPVGDVVIGAGAAEEGGGGGQRGQQQEAGQVRAQVAVVVVERASAPAQPLPEGPRPLLHGERVAAYLAGAWVCGGRGGEPPLETRLVDEAAGSGAAAGRDERLGLAEVVADAAEGRRRAGRVRRRAGQPGQRGREGRAEAAGDAAHVQRSGDLKSCRS